MKFGRRVATPRRRALVYFMLRFHRDTTGRRALISRFHVDGPRWARRGGLPLRPSPDIAPPLTTVPPAKTTIEDIYRLVRVRV